MFAQEYEHHEVLVVNDGSPDTAALEAAIAAYRERIVYIEQPNGGPSAARNAGIMRARGAYVAFLDGDDQWFPDCLADQVARATSDPSLAAVYGDALIIGESADAGRSLMDLSPSVGEADFLNLLTERCVIPTSCAMVRRDACIAAGMFDPALRRSEDFDLWLRIAHAGGRFSYTRKQLGRYRRHETSASSDLFAMADAAVAVFDKIERLLPLTDEERSAVVTARSRHHAVKNFLHGKRAFAEGDFETARRELAEANTVMRSLKLTMVVRMLGVAPALLWRIYGLTAGRR